MCGGNRISYTVLIRQTRSFTSTASMLLVGGLGVAPRKIFKITCSEIKFEGIFKKYIYLYRDNSYIRCTHIIAVCLFIIISTSVATGSHY